MKKLLPFFFIQLVPFFLFAQYGISFGGAKMIIDEWKIPVDQYLIQKNSHLFEHTIVAGIDYRLKLKDTRIEFYPGITFSKAVNYIEMSKFSFQTFGVALNINIYLFDLYGNCNCPTFSKKGNLFKKGFFFQISPAFDYLQLKYSASPSDSFYKNIDTKIFEFCANSAIGLDIGLSDFLTITPLVGVKYYPETEWNDLTYVISKGVEEGTYNKNDIFLFLAKIRIGLQF